MGYPIPHMSVPYPSFKGYQLVVYCALMGLKMTWAIARIVMMLFDKIYSEKVLQSDLNMLMYKRYVDDSNQIVRKAEMKITVMRTLVPSSKPSPMNVLTTSS